MTADNSVLSSPGLDQAGGAGSSIGSNVLLIKRGLQSERALSIIVETAIEAFKQLVILDST